MRALDQNAWLAGRPVHTYDKPEPIAPGEIVPVDIALGPSATRFRAPDGIRLVIAGPWLWPINRLTDQFPATYAKGPEGQATLHLGPDRPAARIVLIIHQ